MSWLRCMKSIGVVLLLGAALGRAEATVVYSDTVLVRGPEYATAIELSLPATGTYRVTATDLHWLNVPLQALSFGVFTATSSLATHVGAGTLEFFNAGQGKVFLQLYALTAPSKSAGLVSLQAESVATVALPASLWLLLSALGATGFWRWWERRVGEFARPLDTATAV
jgi:hypothetical protein